MILCAKHYLSLNVKRNQISMVFASKMAPKKELPFCVDGNPFLLHFWNNRYFKRENLFFSNGKKSMSKTHLLAMYSQPFPPPPSHSLKWQVIATTNTAAFYQKIKQIDFSTKFLSAALILCLSLTVCNRTHCMYFWVISDRHQWRDRW